MTKGQSPTPDKPVILLTQARRSWFVLDNEPYSLMACSASVFRRFIARQAPRTWTDPEARQLLQQRTLDDFDRWYILLSLGKHLKRQQQALPFYETQQLAENAISANSERAISPASQLQEPHRSKRAKRVRSAKLAQTA